MNLCSLKGRIFSAKKAGLDNSQARAHDKHTGANELPITGERLFSSLTDTVILNVNLSELVKGLRRFNLERREGQYPGRFGSLRRNVLKAD